ncbi:hypothetical protein Tco_0647580 [Tanacetum coccineum]
MGDTIAQSRSENVSTMPNDSPLLRINTLGSNEGSLKLMELMELCTKLLHNVLDLETEGRRIEIIDADTDMFGVNDKDGDELIVESEVTVKADEEKKLPVSVAATTTIDTTTIEEITIAQELYKLKTSKPKVKGVVFKEPGESTTTKFSQQSQQPKGKGKEKMVEYEPPMKKKNQIQANKETAIKLQIVQESVKKQKVDDETDTAGLQKIIKVIPEEEEVAIDAIPLSIKPSKIVSWKIHKEGKKSYNQIERANGSSKMYLVFSHMLKSFDREDLEDLYRLVKDRYGSTRPEEGFDRVLWGDLMTMLEPHGRIVGIKRLLDAVMISDAHIGVTAALEEVNDA